ncbi:MAG: alpha/beta fold hydrolase [Dehalococcoidia bacterium]
MSLRADIPDQYVDVDGLKIRYIEKGSGRPLLMVHGMGYALSADQFLPQIDALSEIAHVFALDLPGWGLSDAPAEGPYFPLWAGVLKGFCDQLGLEQIDIFTYSIGGWISALFAVENPERVRRMVLVDSPGLNLVAPDFVTNFRPPTREALGEEMAGMMRGTYTEAMVDELYARINRPGAEDAYRRVASYVVDPEVRKENSLHSVYPRLPMPILFGQVDNASAVLIRFVFEAYQLAPHPRMFIYYAGSKGFPGGIVPEMEAVAIDFLTADEVPPPARK